MEESVALMSVNGKVTVPKQLRARLNVSNGCYVRLALVEVLKKGDGGVWIKRRLPECGEYMSKLKRDLLKRTEPASPILQGYLLSLCHIKLCCRHEFKEILAPTKASFFTKPPKDSVSNHTFGFGNSILVLGAFGLLTRNKEVWALKYLGQVFSH